MGYLDNSTVTVDAILTTKGRQLLASGAQNFKITQFALGDDEVDYSLWNTDHPLGTDYYGIIIENMPIVEASPDETQALRSKLITLPKGQQYIPTINIGVTTITFNALSQVSTIAPTTGVQNTTLTGANNTYGYTLVLSDNTIADVTVTQALAAGTVAPTSPSFVGDSTTITALTVVGKSFQIRPRANLTTTGKGTITIFANETGGSVTIPITVNANLV